MIEGTPVAVHRCRFVDFTPSAVTALAFPPLPLPSVKGKQKSKPNKEFKFGTLAIGRANGNIELCEWTGSERSPQAPQAWVVRKVRHFKISRNGPSLSNSNKDLDWTVSIKSGVSCICYSRQRCRERRPSPFAFAAATIQYRRRK